MAKKKAKKTTSTKKTTAKKKATKKKKKSTRKNKAAVEARKRLIWAVYSSSMKEEGRFPYDQKKDAEKKLAQLSSKSKKSYFILPVKEVIAEGTKKKKAKGSGEEE